MLSRFFIDRPIFATVLSVLITFVGAISLFALPIAQYPRITPPGVQVAITYPGANAQVVADTVAAPIEQQVTGVPGMLYMSSQSGNDGSYTLSTTFDVSTDLNTALVMVQNRVTLAMPLLPTPVQKQGIRIRKKTPDILLMVNFYADKEHPEKDDIYLSNYAFMHVKDEVLRVDGVSDVNIIGERDYSIRAWLDPQKLAALNMSATEVSAAIVAQNIEVAPGQVGQPPAGRNQSSQYPIDIIGRLTSPEDGDIIVKVGADKPPAAKKGGRPTSAPAAGPSGLPSSGTNDPLASSGSMNGASTASKSNSSSSGNGAAPTTTSATDVPSDGNPSTSGAGSTGGGGTAGGSTATGGGTTAGGGASQGGGTTGGSANGAGSVVADNATDDALSGLSIDADTTGQPVGGAVVGRPKLVSNGIVRLKQVCAKIERGAQNYNQACYFNGRPSVGISVYQLPGTNALDVADRIRDKMEELKLRFPDGVHYKIGYDTTPFIRESVEEVFSTLRDAVILVTLVVLLFLQDWRAMILPMIDVPVSLIGTFAVMAVMGFSLNNISLFGLVLAIGIVVDDAIVVLENIERQMAKGLKIRPATIKAMEEISGPVIAITIVLCAVFVPCAFISGITGRFFRQFAVTIAASTIISAINALTMTPSRALIIFRMEEAAGLTPGAPTPGHGHDGHGGHARPKEALPWWVFGLIGAYVAFLFVPKHFASQLDEVTKMLGIAVSPESGEPVGWDRWTVNGLTMLPGILLGLPLGWLIIKPANAVLAVFFRGFNWFFDLMTTVYGWIIAMGMRLSAVVLLIYVGLLGLTYVVFVSAPTGFVPQQDMGRFIVGIQLPDSASLERTKEAALEVTEAARAEPGVSATVTMCGISFVQQASSPNFASLFVVLKPFKDRQKPELKVEAIMARLRTKWKEKVKDAQAVALSSSPVPGLSVAGGFKILVEDKADLGLDVLQKQTDALVRKLKDEPGLTSVSTSFRSKTPQYKLDIDRTKVASLGCSLDDVNKTLEIYLGSSYPNSYNEFGRLWQVTLQADGRFRNRIEDVNLYQVRNKFGQMVSLGTLCNIREISGPIFVTRYNLSTSAAITGGLKPGISTGEVIDATDKTALDTLPRSMKTEWTELMFMQLLEGNTAIYIFALAVLCVFLALAALYESWALPLAVILVVPLCILCSVVGVLLTNNSVNIFVQIGLVVLVGLACKNAILVVEFARELHEDGKSVFDATLESSRLRLRPILMTSFAFILGVLPLVVASGAGAEMRKSLGTAVFSGMLGVTAFGIFLTPVFFFVIQGVGETSLFANKWVRTGLSLFFGGLLGGTAGWILERLGVVYHYWGMAVGVVVGMLMVGGIRGIIKTVGANAGDEWRGLRRPRK